MVDLCPRTSVYLVVELVVFLSLCVIIYNCCPLCWTQSSHSDDNITISITACRFLMTIEHQSPSNHFPVARKRSHPGERPFSCHTMSHTPYDQLETAVKRREHCSLECVHCCWKGATGKAELYNIVLLEEKSCFSSWALWRCLGEIVKYLGQQKVAS